MVTTVANGSASLSILTTGSGTLVAPLPAAAATLQRRAAARVGKAAASGGGWPLAPRCWRRSVHWHPVITEPAAERSETQGRHGGGPKGWDCSGCLPRTPACLRAAVRRLRSCLGVLRGTALHRGRGQEG